MRIFAIVAAAGTFLGSIGYGASSIPAANTGNLDSKQWGLLAIQDGGRRKPMDTFARETLIRVTGRSTYIDKTGRTWRRNDFVLSALIETHDWKNEPMVLISSGQLVEQLGLNKTQRRFSFAQLTGSAELQRLVTEAQALKRAEKPLTRVQQEALSVSDRLTLLAHVMDGSALLIVPAPANVLALAFHAAGIVMRCMIADRPPVTNMYEFIIRVSFAVSFFGMIFFMRYR